MKKALYVSSGLIPLVYVILFCVYGTKIAAMHMDLQFYIPLDVLMLSALLAVGLFIADRIKKLNKKLYFIPLMFFAAGVITLVVGYFTHCPYCV